MVLRLRGFSRRDARALRLAAHAEAWADFVARTPLIAPFFAIQRVTRVPATFPLPVSRAPNKKPAKRDAIAGFMIPALHTGRTTTSGAGDRTRTGKP
jgi:hypothetical protein